MTVANLFCHSESVLSLEQTLLLLGPARLGTGQTTSTSGCDQANLSAGGSVSPDGGGVANVLMISTTVRMLDGVHGHTADLRPGVPLGLVLEVCPSGLEHGLVDSATTGN